MLEAKGEFLQSFRLHISEHTLSASVFTWIQEKFSILSQAVDKKKRFEELKNMVAGHMREIIEIDTEKTIELIEKWYDD